MNENSTLENIDEKKSTKLDKRKRKLNTIIKEAIENDKELSKKLLEEKEKISPRVSALTVEKVLPAFQKSNFCLFEESPYYIHRVLIL